MNPHHAHGCAHDHDHPADPAVPYGHVDHQHGGLGRRAVLASAGGLLMLAAMPGSARAAHATQAGSALPLLAASRTSKLTQGTTLVHADMHNHTVMSDGDGSAQAAFGSMREAGLDVAALTDHATLFAIDGLSSGEWSTQGQLADAANDPGQFTAIRGFEWSSPLEGHINVWNTGDFADLLRAAGPGNLYNWLAARPAGLGSFNHPGREPGRFNEFAFKASVLQQMVGLEMFNRTDDYLFEGWSSGKASPLVVCLNSGWRPGLTGVTDEHGTTWGFHEGKGRSGLWVTENTRAGVFEAMRARRSFATRVSGLRVDATANGVRMGGTLPVTSGDVRFLVDIDRGPDWDGKPLRAQVLRPGTKAPTVVDVVDTVNGAVADLTVPLNAADGNWVVLRVSDPSVANGTPGPAGHACNDFGVAYTSPWWLGA
ncbi:CehA/McbA family metallohydrolase [Streptomyces sp. TRM66268-LWL]|uniref:CehA/McbA family metallohydrolase n=1 Tax=Streptomyces polyasparticus TaxID=2767826 RepID=A0ABR7S8Y4_9ACTN|nr:CehA/McbA family metallohydrolase [Streptomyces polyasparticus]MBC9710996.1 CehA/McbA family metallohydrolase [Streptomyces polyasparticus]